MPYELSENTERHYQAIFYVVFTLMGQFVETEVRSARGRADAVVKTKDFIFVFEFKLNGTAEEALKQIDEKRVFDTLYFRWEKVGESRGEL